MRRSFIATLLVALFFAGGAAPTAVASETSNSLRPTTSWGLDRLDGTMDGVYKSAGTGQGVRIYIVDTGVDANHPELLGRVAAGYDAFGEGLEQKDCNGHGTHIAGVAAGSNYGVADKATIVPVRVLNCSNQGNTATLASGIDWILANHAVGSVGVVNMSFAGRKSKTVDDSVARLIAAGLIVVAAAGNFSADACLYSPAGSPQVITVGATDQGNQRAASSNWGSCIDVFAPGSRILSANHLDYSKPSSRTGTSQSAPFVSGLLASFISSGRLSSQGDAMSALLASAEQGIVTDAKSFNNYFVSARSGSLGVSLDTQELSSVQPASLANLLPPPTPRTLSIKFNRLSWQGAQSVSKYGEVTYIVEERTANGWRVIGTTLNASYKLSSENTSSTSVYRVIASNASGRSGPTAGITNVGAQGAALIVPIPDISTALAGGLRATQAGVRSAVVHLSWAEVQSTIRYNIEVAPAGTEQWTLARTTATLESMITQTPGRRVLVRVTAIGATGLRTVVGTIQYEGLR